NLENGIDISIPISEDGVKAWFVGDVSISPVVSGDYVGSLESGSPVNFMNVTFNPHGNGTHTECLSHIYKSDLTINTILKNAFTLCRVISVNPTQITHTDEIVSSGDLVITEDLIKEQFTLENGVNAIAIRTLPNVESKKTKNYSGSNPIYFHPNAITYLIRNGIDHLLIDLPSVDREEDGGKVLSHHTFWEIPESPALHRTITELIFVPNQVPDGLYLLNLQVASF